MTCPACGCQLDEEDAAFCGLCGARARPRRSTLTGVVLDERYQIEAKLAEGGFGSIYRATHVASGLDVALKVLHADLAADASLAARFRREAACLERLHDPHTVATYETGEAPDGTLYIAMELLDGESLHDRLARTGRLGWRTALAIVRDACSSLAEAHELGIVHRDLKPANLHLTTGDEVKVLDFGIARIASSELDDGAELTRMGQMIGTIEYMAPEQVIGGSCDARSDIYQLGILAYEMIVGRRPFVAASTTGHITALLTQTPSAPSTLLCGACLPHEVDALILRCLEREPEHRFASVHRLVDAIDAALLLGDTAPERPRVRRSDDEAPTWIASAHSNAATVAPARTSISALPAAEIVRSDARDAIDPRLAVAVRARIATGTASPVVVEMAEGSHTSFPPGVATPVPGAPAGMAPAMGALVPVGDPSVEPLARPATAPPVYPRLDTSTHAPYSVPPRLAGRRDRGRPMAFATRVVLWSAALAAGGVAVGAALATLFG